MQASLTEDLRGSGHSDIIPFTGARKKYAYVVVFVLLLCYTSNQLNRWLITFVKSDLQQSTDISNAQYGLLTGYAFSVIFGRWCE
jgi:hypothetical protein